MARLIKLTFLGDILCEQDQIYAITHKKSHYGVVFDQVKHLWADSDFTIGNLETPLAGKELKLAYEKMRFNAPIDFGKAIKAAGIDFVTLANNHALDRGVPGLNATISNLDKIGISHAGAYSAKEDSEEVTIKNVRDVRIAFTSCTYGVNQGLSCFSLPDDELWRVDLLKYPQTQETTKWFLVKRFITNMIPFPVKRVIRDWRKTKWLPREADSVQSEEFGKEIHELFLRRILEKIRYAKRQADLVVVLPHIGGQYVGIPGEWQKKVINAFVEAGADIIVANHAHVPQAVKKLDGVLVAYCLGNFCFTPTSATTADGHADYSILLNCWIDLDAKKLMDQDYVLLKTVKRPDGISVVVPTHERWLEWEC